MANFNPGVIAAAMVGLSATVALAAEGETRSEAPSLPSVVEDVAGDADRMRLLEERIAELSDRIRRSEEERRRNEPPLTINGYADLGFFATTGNRGAGWIRDEGNDVYPEHGADWMSYPNGKPFGWTFLGDLLATTINTRGDVADLGDAPGAAGVRRFDSVNSDGAPGFIANEVNLRIGYALTDRALLRTSVNFIPRAGSDFRLGDYMEVDVAELEYVATRDGNSSLFVGKMMPVFGIEYKERKSDQRFGITPSLIQRYTAGSQLGVKWRSKLLNDFLIVAVSATNNSSGTEQFHFSAEIDRNRVRNAREFFASKTLNGRLAVSIPVAITRLELGFSGQWGAQDWATDTDGKMWFVGPDFQFVASNFAVKAQGIVGRAPGLPEDMAWRLRLRPSGYLEVNWLATGFLGFIARVENRDATVELGAERIYITKQARVTGGVRVIFNPHIVLKAEYLKNIEYGRIPAINNDVFTSALVLSY
jgi:hypothetical protein